MLSQTNHLRLDNFGWNQELVNCIQNQSTLFWKTRSGWLWSPVHGYHEQVRNFREDPLIHHLIATWGWLVASERPFLPFREWKEGHNHIGAKLHDSPGVALKLSPNNCGFLNVPTDPDKKYWKCLVHVSWLVLFVSIFTAHWLLALLLVSFLLASLLSRL